MIGLDFEPRPLRPDDADRLVRMFDRLSAQTVLFRFFGPLPTIAGPVLDGLLAVDHDRSEAFVVPVGDEIVAIASYHRDHDDPSTAEVAVLVEDGWQHHGIGRRLVGALGRAAAQRGVERFDAEVLPANRPAVGLIERTSPGAHATFAGAQVHYDLPLVPAA